MDDNVHIFLQGHGEAKVCYVANVNIPALLEFSIEWAFYSVMTNLHKLMQGGYA
jgi:hypothetical protein